MKCEKCGNEMQYYEQELTCGWSCPECGWGLVTTKLNPMFEDSTTYTIFLAEGNTPNIEVIKTLSKVCNQNYLSCKALLANPDSMLFSGKAYDVADKKKLLDDSRIHYRIDPIFPY